MNYQTPEQVLFIHYRLLAETGGSHGVGDLLFWNRPSPAPGPHLTARSSIRTCS
jgi:hypothetical protein